jgi:hypothetical protein
MGFAAPHLCAIRHAYSEWSNTQPLYGTNSHKEATNAYFYYPMRTTIRANFYP